MAPVIELGMDLKDEATATWNRFVGEVESGSRAIDQHAQSTNKLTQWIRDQRVEQRQQTFLFREGRNVVDAVGNSTRMLTTQYGAHSAALAKVNTGLMSGFASFQAIDFTMASLGVSTGGTTLAIAGLVAGGTALYAFLDQTEAHAKNAEKGIKNLEGTLVGLGQKQIEGLRSQALAEIEKTKKAMKDASPTLLGDKPLIELFFPTKNQNSLDQTLKSLQAQVGLYDAALKPAEQLNLEEMQRIEGLDKEIALLKVHGTITEKYLGQEIDYERQRMFYIQGSSELSAHELDLMRQRLELVKQNLVQDRAMANLREGKTLQSATDKAIEDQFPELKALRELDKTWAKLPTAVKALINKRDASKMMSPFDLKKENLSNEDPLKQMTDNIEVFDAGWQRALNAVDQLAQQTANDFYDYFSGNVAKVDDLFKNLVKDVGDSLVKMAFQLASQALFSQLLGFLFPAIGFGGFFTGIAGIATGALGGGGKSTTISDVRTPEDRANSGTTIIFNNHAPMTSQEAILDALSGIVRATGQTIDKIAVNSRANVSLAAS